VNNAITTPKMLKVIAWMGGEKSTKALFAQCGKTVNLKNAGKKYPKTLLSI